MTVSRNLTVLAITCGPHLACNPGRVTPGRMITILAINNGRGLACNPGRVTSGHGLPIVIAIDRPIVIAVLAISTITVMGDSLPGHIALDRGLAICVPMAIMRTLAVPIAILALKGRSSPGRGLAIVVTLAVTISIAILAIAGRLTPGRGLAIMIPLVIPAVITGLTVLLSECEVWWKEQLAGITAVKWGPSSCTYILQVAASRL